MGRAHNDDKGWKKGLGAYSAADCGLMSHGKDDGDKPPREVSYVMNDIGRGDEYAGYNSPQWKVGALPGGKSPPRYAPKGDATTRQVSAASPSGKYGKKGGSGQRSGA